MSDPLGNPRVVQLLIWLVPPGLALVGLLASGLVFGVILAVLGLNMVLTSELLLRQSARRFTPQILESERDIVDQSARMLTDAELELLYIWTADYSDPKTDAVRRSEKVFLESKRPEFRMRVRYGPRSVNWTPERCQAHRDSMQELITSGKHSFAPTTTEALELSYADYVDDRGSRQYRAYINFVLPDRTPYGVISFDTGIDGEHERVSQSIKRIFEAEGARAS
ncbi:MAG: hypothetical protein L3K14_04330 [Thermoplasmata archaeon]|nr:hypothetical protein [Thermoplasmata archaeon]